MHLLEDLKINLSRLVEQVVVYDMRLGVRDENTADHFTWVGCHDELQNWKIEGGVDGKRRLVLLRFCGTSAGSGSGLLLVRSLIRQIAYSHDVYGIVMPITYNYRYNFTLIFYFIIHKYGTNEHLLHTGHVSFNFQL